MRRFVRKGTVDVLWILRNKRKSIAGFLSFLFIFCLLLPGAQVLAVNKTPAPTITKKTLYTGGDSYRIRMNYLSADSKIQYQSSNKAVARVTTKGVIKPVGKGTATVNVTVTNGKNVYRSEIAVTVKQPYVQITNPIDEMEIGETYRLEAKVYGLKKTKTAWKVSDETIAVIDPKTRVLTALSDGTVTVTFSDQLSKKSSEIKITVLPDEQEEWFEPEDELYGLELEEDHLIITEIYDSGVTSLDIPAKIGGYPVTMIEDDALAGLKELTTVTIPDSVVYIGDSAFSGCASLESVTLPKKLTYLGECAFEDCEALAAIKLPDTLPELCEQTFLNCTSLKSVTLPNKLETIGCEAFMGCTSLTSITIPKSVALIDSGAFCECEKLTKVTFSSGLETLEDEAFSGCIGLTSVTLPSTLTYLGSFVFEGCEKLKSVLIPASVEDIGSGAFDDCSESLKLRVKKNSTAHEYAVDYEIPFSLY